MNDFFISPERKLSGTKNKGIQYIPGHTEPLVDLIVNEYLPDNNEPILDLGGGGLRFAIPVASLNKRITVVDLDESSVNIDQIFSRMRENELTDYNDLNILKKNIEIIVDDVFHFLETTDENYSLITAFRLIHFFNEKEIDKFFGFISDRLRNNGRIIVSGFVQNDSDNITKNEIFNNSRPVGDNLYYRLFNKSNLADKIQKEQNLSPMVHLFSEDYLMEYCNKYKLKLVASNLPSTRIVRGFIFTN